MISVLGHGMSWPILLLLSLSLFNLQDVEPGLACRLIQCLCEFLHLLCFQSSWQPVLLHWNLHKKLFPTERQKNVRNGWDESLEVVWRVKRILSSYHQQKQSSVRSVSVHLEESFSKAHQIDLHDQDNWDRDVNWSSSSDDQMEMVVSGNDNLTVGSSDGLLSSSVSF